MTKEEARLTLQDNFGYLSQEHPRILEALRVALDALSRPFLPSNLNEAAVQAHIRMEESGEEMTFLNTFKAGAEWMAGQGMTKEAVIGMATKDIEINVSGQVLDELELGPGDKVIVQIRKK